MPKVQGIEYPPFTATDPILVKIFDEHHVVDVEKYEVNNLTCEILIVVLLNPTFFILNLGRLHPGLASLPCPDEVGPLPDKDGRFGIGRLLLVRLFHPPCRKAED